MVLALCKVVGTVSLGILAGASVSYSALMRSLVAGPSSQSPAQLAAVSKPYEAIFFSSATTSIVALALSYVLSRPTARHPYLLYAVVATGVVSHLAKNAAMLVARSEDSSKANATVSSDSTATATATTTATINATDTVRTATRPAPAQPVAPIHSELDNSVYAEIETPSLSDSSPSDSSPPSSPRHQPARPVKPSAYWNKVADCADAVLLRGVDKGLGAQLVRLSSFVCGLSSAAFVVATVGIYGDYA